MKKIKFLIKCTIKVLAIILLIDFFPKMSIFYLICGILDFQRNELFDLETINRYFFGNGLLTWVLSPINLFADLLTFKNKKIYKLKDLPEDCQSEINYLIEVIKDQPEIKKELDKRMEEKKRGMMFFKWYDKNIDNSINISQFHQKFKYIKTIGVSIFNKNQATSKHFGPLRLTLRVLYNLKPIVNDNVYIEVKGIKHLWHNGQLFIFDDTLMHQSVNYSDELRYCMFIDILRPGRFLEVFNSILKFVQIILLNVNRVFYKNWEFLK